jgi:glutaconate CoA-transferase subunit A
VLRPPTPDFLIEYDANVARASRAVVVSVERLADPAEIAGRGVLLHGHEVDAIVVCPGGARPSALPGLHGPDLDRIAAYLATAGGQVRAARAALDALVAT